MAEQDETFSYAKDAYASLTFRSLGPSIPNRTSLKDGIAERIS